MVLGRPAEAGPCRGPRPRRASRGPCGHLTQDPAATRVCERSRERRPTELSTTVAMFLRGYPPRTHVGGGRLKHGCRDEGTGFLT